MKRLWKKAGAVLATITLLLSAAVLPVSAASLSENFEEYSTTDDLSLNWFTDGSFITDLTLSKTGGANGSKGLKADMTFDKNLPKHWALIRALYMDMTSETATGFHFWAKCNYEGVKMTVIMRYNNQSWKYGAEVTLTKAGQYYDIPFTSMELVQGTVSYPDRAQDPMLIDEWQFEIINDWSKDGAVVYLDDMRYIESGQGSESTTQSSNVSSAAPVGSSTTQGGGYTTGVSSAESTDTTVSLSPSGTSITSTDAASAAATTTEKSANTANTEKNKDGLSTGIIAVIVIAAVVVLVGIGVAVYFLVFRKKRT